MGFPDYHEEIGMSDKFDEMKGRTKEAAGALTDDDDLKREGKADQAAGNAKEKIGDAADWAEEQVDNVKDKIDQN